MLSVASERGSVRVRGRMCERMCARGGVGNAGTWSSDGAVDVGTGGEGK